MLFQTFVIWSRSEPCSLHLSCQHREPRRTVWTSSHVPTTITKGTKTSICNFFSLSNPACSLPPSLGICQYNKIIFFRVLFLTEFLKFQLHRTGWFRVWHSKLTPASITRPWYWWIQFNGFFKRIQLQTFAGPLGKCTGQRLQIELSYFDDSFFWQDINGLYLWHTVYVVSCIVLIIIFCFCKMSVYYMCILENTILMKRCKLRLIEWLKRLWRFLSFWLYQQVILNHNLDVLSVNGEEEKHSFNSTFSYIVEE